MGLFLLKNNSFQNQRFPADLPAVPINTHLLTSNKYIALLLKSVCHPDPLISVFGVY